MSAPQRWAPSDPGFAPSRGVGTSAAISLQPEASRTDTHLVTTHTHVPDWKVTTGYRVLVRIGWGATALAVYMAAVALIFESSRAWWLAVALAASAILTGLLLPEPVPGDMLNGSRTMVDFSRSGSR